MFFFELVPVDAAGSCQEVLCEPLDALLHTIAHPIVMQESTINLCLLNRSFIL